MSSGPIRAGLLDVPMELLLRILHDPDTNLFRVAYANRFLNTLVMNHCLPYLKDPGHVDELDLTFTMDDVSVQINKSATTSPESGSQTCKICPSRLCRVTSTSPLPQRPRIPAGADMLAFLSIAFDIKTVGKLRCHFQEASDTHFTLDHLVVFTQMFDRLSRLIKRLDKIDSIDLLFRLDEAGLTESNPPSLVDIFNTSLDQLMKACLAKVSGELRAYGGSFPTTWLHDRSPKLLERITNVFKSNNSTLDTTVGGLYWNLTRRSTSPTTRTISAFLTGNDASSYLRCPSPLNDTPPIWRTFPPSRLHLRYSDWSHRYLSPGAFLTDLTIEAVNLTPEDWKGFLSCLYAPLQATLVTLKIKNCDLIPARSLVKFIHRLPRLTHLTLLPPFSAFHYMDSYPISLPNLVYVCAPSDFLSLFSPKTFSLTVGSRLPKLKTMQIIPICQFAHGHPFDTTSCQPKIAEILAAHPRVSRIILDLTFSGTRDLDIPSTNDPADVTSRIGDNSIDITYPPSPEFTSPPSYSRISEILLPASLLLIFFLTDTSSVNHELVRDLIDFLVLFNGLKTLRIVHDLATTFDGHAQRKENGWMEVVDERVFRLLKARCGGLRTVKLEGVDGEVRVHDL